MRRDYTNYSIFSLIKGAFTQNTHWAEAWQKTEPKHEYDVIIVGGGGHGLATAYYLAKEHNIHNICVLEKSGIGLGSVGRNTTIVRSNYGLDGNTQFYELSMKLWEKLDEDLNYNVMFSQRGIVNLFHSPAEADSAARRGNALRLNGIDSVYLDNAQLRRKFPLLDFSMNARFPIYGGLMQPRAGTARHDAVAWGFARKASALGVDICEQTEVLDFIWNEKRTKIIGVQTNKGNVYAKKIGLTMAGNISTLANKANLRLPIESHVLQAFVSESIKPKIDNVITYAAGHVYISQSDKGGLVFGGDLDKYNSYAQRGNLPAWESVASSICTLIPSISRIKILRNWGGVMDMSMDGSPIISTTDISGLYLNTGWCYGGFKATPGSGFCFAHTIAKNQPHPQNALLSLNRFASGATIDESGAGPVPKNH